MTVSLRRLGGQQLDITSSVILGAKGAAVLNTQALSEAEKRSQEGKAQSNFMLGGDLA